MTDKITIRRKLMDGHSYKINRETEKNTVDRARGELVAVVEKSRYVCEGKQTGGRGKAGTQ